MSRRDGDRGDDQGVGAVSEELNLHGRGGSLSANTESCLLRDPDGNVLDRTRDESGPLDVFLCQAEAFAAAIMALLH